MRGPLARLDRSRDELAKAWLVRLIERASLDEIQDLPTDQLARDLPELISELLQAAGDDDEGPTGLSESGVERAAALATMRAGRDASAGDLARDVAALQSVILHALRNEFDDPEELADSVERLADAVGAVQAAAVEELVRRSSRELETQANTDPLTGLYNLRYLQRHIGHLLDVHKRYEHPFSVLLLDIDGLKRVNDAHGHAAGDRVLMQVAMSLRRSVRSVDTPARLGGDEFCVLAPHQTASNAVVLAGRLAAAVQEDVPAPAAPPISVSIGVVSCPEHGDQPDGLIEQADRAMYRAKASGDDVAVGEGGEPEPAEEAKPKR